MEGALRLSAHVLAARKAELPSQLTGRLLDHQEPSICALCRQVLEQEKAPWLRPLKATRTTPGGPLLRTLEYHRRAEANSVALSGDGRLAVSGLSDNTLQVWDLENGACLRTLEGHTGGIDAVAVTSNGRRAVSGSSDSTLRLWDLESGACLRTLEGHTSFVEAVALRSNGRRAVSGSSDSTLRLWDLESGQCLHILEGHTAEVNVLALGGNGQQAVSGSCGDKTHRVWDLESGACFLSFTGDGCVRALAATADLTTIVAGDASGRVYFLRAEGLDRASSRQ